MAALRDSLERGQIPIYFAAVGSGAVFASLFPSTSSWDVAINPVLALMLFVTFLQVPLAELRQAFGKLKFVRALLLTNFVAVPLVVAAMTPFLPSDPMIRLGILLVLLCPCIDYVVTFAHLGRADARMLLASTPVLLIVQMLALPIYLRLFLGSDAADLVHPEPFLHAFI